MPNNLKFRAWDLKLKKFSFFDLSYCLPIYGNEEEFIVQRWTGFIDKNGADIYEGDICRGVATYNEYENPYIGQIKWLDGCFFFSRGNENQILSERHTVNGYTTLEKVGNIFEK